MTDQRDTDPHQIGQHQAGHHEPGQREPGQREPGEHLTEQNDAEAFSPQRRKLALFGWRVGLAADHPGRALTDHDLEVISTNPATDPALIARIPIPSGKRLLRQLADELSEVLLAVQPRSAPSGTDRQPPPEPDLIGLSFAPLDLSRYVPAASALPITTAVSDRALLLRWPVSPGPATLLYRVVAASARDAPPEYGRLLAVTAQPEAADDRPFDEPVRLYQVWLHEGRDTAAAAAAQPRLHAFGAVVAPVQDFEIVLDETVVVGRWRQVDGAVEVHRLAPGGGYDPANQLLGEVHAAGFRDTTARPGHTYQYDVYAWASVGGHDTQSAPVSAVVTIPAVLEPVTDLHVDVYDAGDRIHFDLSWTAPPDGQVWIYRTQHEPNPGLQDQTRALDAIEREGLVESALVKHPTRFENGRARIAGVPWPSGWPRAHFTPVTVGGATGRVGPSVAKVRAGAVRDAMLVERVDYQMAVFNWPDGAASVAAYLTPPNVPMPNPAGPRPQAEISREQYERDGGLLLPLAGDAVDVHLVSKIWDRGQPSFGPPAVLHYPGLLRIAYDLVAAPSPAEERGLLRRRTARTQVPATHVLRLVADRDLQQAPQLSLLHNIDRLPLSPYDGTFVAHVAPVPLARNVYTEAAPLDLRTCRGGYVRLFATDPDPAVPVAVLDPDVELLRRP